MAKGGLSKLKCMIKRWHSSSRISRTPRPSSPSPVEVAGGRCPSTEPTACPRGSTRCTSASRAAATSSPPTSSATPSSRTSSIAPVAPASAVGPSSSAARSCCSSTSYGCSRTPTRSRSRSTSSSSTTRADRRLFPEMPAAAAAPTPSSPESRGAIWVIWLFI
ncbi:hypothetical protein HU200_037617 [Digitaria exilis]|uniref:Uncharacterized protein n=1 Tax=Digitaria exilis TaxID=1010633 RepID=A0A835EH77_9POAL|nr:hypothetical protein HU200_037617 [Digitaria exilis]